MPAPDILETDAPEVGSYTAKLPPPRIVHTPEPPKMQPVHKAPKHLTTADVQQQQAVDADSSDSALGHWFDALSDAATRGLTAIPGMIGDVLTQNNPVADARRIVNDVKGKRNPPPEFHLPGMGPVSQKIQETIGTPPPARSKAEEYVRAAVSGAAALPTGPEGMIMGALSGIGSQAGADVTPDSEWGPFIGGLVVPGAAGIAHGVAKTRPVRIGMQRPEFPDIVQTIKNLEGGGTVEAPNVSPKGARGPMQVMPDTARDPGFGIKPWDGKSEIDRVRVGVQYAAALTHKYDGDTAKILAAYNAGPGRVDGLVRKYGDRWFEHLPDETKGYLARGLKQHDMTVRSNGVPPIPPEEMANIMNDPEAVWANSLLDDELTGLLQEGAKNREDFRTGAISVDEFNNREEDRIARADDYRAKTGLPPREDHNVVDISDQMTSKQIDNLYNRMSGLRDEISDGTKTADPAKLEEIRGMLNDELQRHDIGTGDHDALIQIDDILKESIALQGGKPRLYELPAETPYLGMYPEKPRSPANEDVILKTEPETDEDAANLARYMTAHNDTDMKTLMESDVHRLEIMHKGRQTIGNMVITKDGRAILDIDPPKGGGRLNLGPTEIRSLAKQLKEQFPQIKSFGGERISGAKAVKNKQGVYTEVPAERTPRTAVQHIGEPKTPANINEKEKRTFGQLMKDLWNDESASYRDDPLGDRHYTNLDYSQLTPEQKLVKAVTEAKPIREEQQAMYHEHRRQQAARLRKVQEAGGSYEEMLGVLKGELPKASYESIAKHFKPEEVAGLYKQIRDSQLGAFEKVNALTALKKIMDPKGMQVPTDSELSLLHDVFHSDLTKAIKARDQKMTPGKVGLEVLNAPRAIMSSADISAPARQGIVLSGRKEFWQNYPKMLKMFADKDFFNAKMEEIKKSPNYGLMREADLAVRDTGHLNLVDREDVFMSHLPEAIPIAGKLVQASDRAYSGFLRKLRADVFDTLIQQGRERGIQWEGNPAAVKALGKFINSATGRGKLEFFGHSFEQAAPFLNSIFFAPRLIKARIDMLNPKFYYDLYKASPFVAAQAMKDMSKFIAGSALILSLAVAGGAQVVGDLRSADSLKIKIGNTRIDTLGGFQQFLVLARRLQSGQKMTQAGNVQSLTDHKFGESTRYDVADAFLANKFAPVPGLIRDWMKGQDPTGKEFDIKTEASNLVQPMWVPDLVQAMQQLGPEGAWLAIPALIGFGVQTYAPRKSKNKQSKKDFGNDFNKDFGSDFKKDF